MRNKIYILGFMLIFNYSFSQVTVKGIIINEETKQPLPFVNVGIINTSLGTVSNEKGEFQISSKSEQYTLGLSHIGFQSQEINVSIQNQDLNILLKPSTSIIDEVNIVSTNFDKELILGVKNEKGRGKSIGFANAQLGTELGALIRVEKETFVKSVNFVLNHAKGDSLLLRVNMYNYEKGEIGDKILQKNLYIKDKQRVGEISMNIEAFEIILDNDILLTLEWLRNFDEGGNKLITFDTKKSKKMKGTFIRNSKTSEFKRLPFNKKLKPCIYLIGKQNSK